MDRIVDLKRTPGLVKQYVQLRNSCLDWLLTDPVTTAETLEWLKKDDIETWGLAEGDDLLGAVVLYLAKDNEIAFFAKERGRGTGTRLLGIIEEVARRRNAETIRAWVLLNNAPARRAFEKAGFEKIAESRKDFKERAEMGIDYRKRLRGEGAA